MTALREALAAKRVRETTYLVAISDDTDAQRELVEARRTLLLVGAAKSDDDDPALARAKAAVDAAQADVDACYFPIRLRGISPADFESLVSAHPPKSGSDTPWDKDSLAPAIVAACQVGDDRLTEDEWTAELASGRWTRGDVDALFVAAMSVNVRAVNASLGND